MYNKYNDGWIEVITGPMYAGKSAELIKRAESLIYAKKQFKVFKPSLDDRWDINTIKSRTGAHIDSIVISDPEEILKHINNETRAIIVDEAQFFDDSLPSVLKKVAGNGIRVIVAGLDMDFRMEPFKPMPEILATSEFVTKLTAVCFRCGRSAAFSKRIKGSEDVLVETGDDTYEARCRQCFSEGGE